MKYIYLDQSTISRLNNDKDPINSFIRKLANNSGFTIVLSFEHVLESSHLGLKKKEAIDDFLNSASNVIVGNNPILMLQFAIESFAQEIISKQLSTSDSWIEVFMNEAGLYGETLIPISETATAKQLHKKSYVGLHEEEKELFRSNGNIYRRKITKKEIEALESHNLPNEFFDVMNNFGFDEDDSRNFIRQISQPMQCGEWFEYSHIQGFLCNRLSIHEVAAVYERWHKEKHLCPALTIYGLMNKKHGAPQSGDFSDAQHLIMLQFVDYLVTDEANKNFLSRELTGEVWLSHLAKVITNAQLEDIVS